jgi:hypothetical protein
MERCKLPGCSVSVDVVTCCLSKLTRRVKLVKFCCCHVAFKIPIRGVTNVNLLALSSRSFYIQVSILRQRSAFPFTEYTYAIYIHQASSVNPHTANPTRSASSCTTPLRLGRILPSTPDIMTICALLSTHIMKLDLSHLHRCLCLDSPASGCGNDVHARYLSIVDEASGTDGRESETNVTSAAERQMAHETGDGMEWDG